MLAVLACYLSLSAWELGRMPLRAGDLPLFGALLACGAICVEASRRLGQQAGPGQQAVPHPQAEAHPQAGASRDLLSAWWLPIALLLPPGYALVAPFVLGVLLSLRVRRVPVYRRVLSSASAGIAGACASIVFRLAESGTAAASPVSWIAYPGTHAWFLRPSVIGVAAGCAALFSALITGLTAVAGHAAGPRAPWREMSWDRESLLLGLTGMCAGILVTIACALTPFLLVMALPPVIVLQRSLMHQQLRTEARTDAKTGLLNAAAWQREADAEVSRALRAGDPVALLLADIDHFKHVNDTHGHLAGDEVLRHLATELRQQVRDSDLVGRFGGEEFVALLQRTGAVEACKVAERLRREASVMNACADGVPVNVTISIGIAVLGTHAGDLPGLLAAADFALYRAKDAGRDQVCLCSAGTRYPGAGTAEPAA